MTLSLLNPGSSENLYTPPSVLSDHRFRGPRESHAAPCVGPRPRGKVHSAAARREFGGRDSEGRHARHADRPEWRAEDHHAVRRTWERGRARYTGLRPREFDPCGRWTVDLPPGPRLDSDQLRKAGRHESSSVNRGTR